MIRWRAAVACVSLCLSLVGCADNSSEAAGSVELTWQEAKARTQAMELEIVESLPPDQVVEVAQMPTGMLIRCDDSRVNWNGATTVTLPAGTEPDPLVRALEEKYRDSRFDIEVRDPAPAGHYDIQLRSPDGGESYLIGEGFDPNTIRIASGSECFPWPEGEYIGGEF